MSKNHNIKNKVQATTFLDTSVPDQVVEVKDTNRDRNLDYIRFGTDNLYPQALASLYRKSVSLRGIINSKVIFTVSGGFILDEESGSATDFVEGVNAKGQSLDDVFEMYLTDRFSGGNSYIQVSTDAAQSFVNYDHIQNVKCRIAKDGENVIIHPNWAKYNSTKKDAVTIPLYPNFTTIDGFKRSVIHVKDYEPDFDHYGIPPYIAAMDAAAIGYKTNKWNVSRLDNAFQTSGVLVVDGNMTDAEAKTLKEEFNKEMTGEGNQGKVMLIIKKLGGEGTEFTAINANTEGDWIQLHNQSNDDLIIANNWKKSLAGISEASGFDTDRILTDYQVVKATSIVKEQNKFIKIIKGVTERVTGLELEGLAIENNAPVSLLTELTADKFTMIWEGRREAGLDFDADDPVQQAFIDNEDSISSAEVNVENEQEDVEEEVEDTGLNSNLFSKLRKIAKITKSIKKDTKK